MFGEKDKEMGLPVWHSPKYEQSKAKALEIIKKYDTIQEGDFWILKNRNKDKTQVIYSGLIISHNGCLKLNDTLPSDLQFDPSCVSMDKDGYGGSLVFLYANVDQGIFEVGEYSRANCDNAYPYAMAFKRLYDRVVLKNSRLAYDGIYSEVEADAFRRMEDADSVGKPNMENVQCTKVERDSFKELCAEKGVAPTEVLKKVGWTGGIMTKAQHGRALKYLLGL